MVQDKLPRHVLTVYEVRDQYGIPISTQRQWRAEGRFVPFFRAGARIVYRRELIERWIEEQEAKNRPHGAVAMADERIDNEATADIRRPTQEAAGQAPPLSPHGVVMVGAVLANPIDGDRA